MGLLSAFFTLLAFSVPAAIIGADDRPKPRRRSRTCWACCGTCRYRGSPCRECGGLGVTS